jgi:broad specificity phosphatase PhoE
MTRFCLIRHGQTDWNLEGRYQGQGDVPLNETGRAQARALAETLKGQTFAAIYSSDLKRASETAQIVAASLGLPVTFDARLREIDQGEWEGQLVEAVHARFTEIWQQRKADPVSVGAPGGETVGQVAVRMAEALCDIAHRYPAEPVLIASHGLALATVICKVRGIPLGRVYEAIPDNAQATWVDWDAAGY